MRRLLLARSDMPYRRLPHMPSMRLLMPPFPILAPWGCCRFCLNLIVTYSLRSFAFFGCTKSVVVLLDSYWDPDSSALTGLTAVSFPPSFADDVLPRGPYLVLCALHHKLSSMVVLGPARTRTLDDRKATSRWTRESLVPSECCAHTLSPSLRRCACSLLFGVHCGTFSGAWWVRPRHAAREATGTQQHFWWNGREGVLGASA